MQELVSDLLTVSRLETGRLPLKEKEVDLGELTKKIISGFEPFAKASNVEIKLTIQPGLPPIISDPSQLELVIENLLDNSIRYIKDKGMVEIKIEKKDKFFRFEIKDTGVGIPEADQRHIFQKFFRSENVLRYQTQGSGLGLYIVKSIIDKMGGKIDFRSKENKGSTFWFTIPIK
jgi:signal transduction histidine kinase